jgi:hypothetical protein
MTKAVAFREIEMGGEYPRLTTPESQAAATIVQDR